MNVIGEVTMDDCIACDLATGRKPLPGGTIHSIQHWLVEHCIGPLNLGTLIVKPKRHVTAVADLSDEEAAELGPLLRQTSAVAEGLFDAEQVYTCLWSHSDGVPGHIHYVVQPVTREVMTSLGAYGPHLQAAMFDRGQVPSTQEIEAVSDMARLLFQHS